MSPAVPMLTAWTWSSAVRSGTGGGRALPLRHRARGRGAAIHATSPQVTYGWGMIPVEVRIGSTRWTTSLWPEERGIRRAVEGLGQEGRADRRWRHGDGAVWPSTSDPVVGAGLYARGMATVHELSRTDARRIAVRAQLLTEGAADRPARDGAAAVAAAARPDERDRAERRPGAVEPAGVGVLAAGALGRRRRAVADRAARDAAAGRGHRALSRRDGRVARHR